jgi:hypothetical protein
VTKESKRERVTSKDEKPRKTQTRKEERRENENFMKHDLLRKKRALSNSPPRIKQPSK